MIFLVVEFYFIKLGLYWVINATVKYPKYGFYELMAFDHGFIFAVDI
jgi:hypothetical protein